MTIVVHNPHHGKGTVLGNGHCARHVQIVSDLGHTSTWRRGDKVLDVASLSPGTIIATFDPNGSYGNHTDGRSHAAIFLEHVDNGIRVVDQWIGKPVGERVIRCNASAKPVNDANEYYVVETAESA